MQGLRIFELLAFAAPKVSHFSFLTSHFSADFRGPPQVYLGCKKGCKTLKTPVFTADVTFQKSPFCIVRRCSFFVHWGFFFRFNFSLSFLF